MAKLADFGVAHLAGDEPLTRTGDVVGTLAYMAPEQAAGRRVDERADLYSLALVLYEALAGTNPVRAGSPAATARRVGTVLPPLKRSRKDLPPALNAAIDRALRPRPEERGTLDELADELAEALPEVSDDGGTVARHPLERTEPVPLPRGVTRAAAAALAGGLLAAALGWTGQPVVAALAAVVAVAVLPRVGWLATAAAVIVLLAIEHAGCARSWPRRRRAPVPLLLYRRGTAWSVPALAPAARPRDARRRLPGAGRPRPRLVRPAPRSARSAPGGCCSTTFATMRAAVVHVRRAALRGRVGGRGAAPALARPRSLARRRRRRRLGLGRRAGRRDRRGGRGDRRTGASPGSCSLPSSPACSRSRYPTSVVLEWWSRDAGPDTVHPQPWPPLPGSGA